MGIHSSRLAGRRARPAVWATGIVAALAAGAVTWVAVTGEGSPAPVAACAGPPVELDVAADPAAAGWLRPLLADYAAADRAAAGRCVAARLRPLGPAEAGQALAGRPGTVRPDLWLPESSTALQLVRSRLAPEDGRALEGPAPSVASSPIVLALPAEAGGALAAGARRPPAAGLAQLLTLARDPAGWARAGRPEWGPVRFTTVDPGTSTLGTSLVLSAVGALTGRAPEEIQPAAFGRVDARGGLLSFARNLVQAEPDAQALLAEAARARTVTDHMRRLGILALYEKDLWRHEAARAGVRLQAVYPLGGLLAADFPLVAPVADRPDPARRAAVDDLRAWLLSEPVQGRLGAAGLRRADGRADLPPPLAQRPGEGQVVPRSLRTVAGAAAAQANWLLINRPVSLLALLDVSGSMAAPVPGTATTKLGLARAAAETSLGFVSRSDSLGLWEFSRDLTPGRDYRQLVALGPVGAGPDRRRAAAAAYRRMTPRGGTGLYDSVLAGYRAAVAGYRPGHVNAVLVLTDGRNEDPGSITLPRLEAELRAAYDPRRPVHVITLAYGADADRAALRRLAGATNGLEFAAVDPREITTVFIAAISSLAG